MKEAGARRVSPLSPRSDRVHALRHYIEVVVSRREDRASVTFALVALVVALGIDWALAHEYQTMFVTPGLLAVALGTLLAGWPVGIAEVPLFVVLNWLALGGRGATLDIGAAEDALRIVSFVPLALLVIFVVELLARTMHDLAARERASAELAQARADLVALASHELRSPLTSIIGYGGMLRAGSTASPELVHEAADVVVRQAERMRSTVERFLSLARLESGAGALAEERFEVREVVRDEAASLRVRAAVEVIERYSSESLVVCSDESGVAQIVRNLLDNAAKYGAGSPISVYLEPVEGQVAVAVCDRGPGVAPEVEPMLFQRFNRAGRRGGEGLGLGLYISHRLAAQLGGSLTFERDPERGTCFVLRLPAG